jgi:hypothetical protein
MLRRTLIATVLLANVCPSAGKGADYVSELMGGPKMRLPNRFHYELTRLPGEPYFKCDPVTNTCMKGITSQGARFVGVVLGQDKKTILAHISCNDTTCISYDTGAILNHPFSEPPR